MEHRQKGEYINECGLWLEKGIAALSLGKKGNGEIEEQGRHLSLAEKALNDALEVLCMRAKYFSDIPEHEIKDSKDMTCQVE